MQIINALFTVDVQSGKENVPYKSQKTPTYPDDKINLETNFRENKALSTKNCTSLEICF